MSGIKLKQPSLKLFFAFLMVLSLSSCAFGTRNVSLFYPPTSLDKEANAKVLEPVSPANGKKVVLVKFSDNRADRLIGNVKNGYGMKTARIISKDDVAEWITHAIALDLKRSGYDVTEVYKKDKVPNDAYFVINGNIINVYTSAYMSYEGEISYYVTLEKEGKKLLEKPYVAQTTTGMNWAARGKSYGEALSQALVIANNNLIADILGVEEKLKNKSV